MHITTRDAVQEYMVRELQAVAASCPGWTVQTPADSSKDALSFKFELEGHALTFWYTIEARLRDQEFLIWFGNYRLGDPRLCWIMRPAVHIGFADISKGPTGPSNVSLGSFLNVSLGDVLRDMILSLENPGGLEELRFQPNTFSMT
jgi:hypothetical protein